MTTHSETQSGSRFAGPGIPDPLLLSSLLDGMDAALFTLDATGGVTHWNREAERLLGWTRAEAVGRPGLGGWALREADAADVRDRLLAVCGAASPRGAGAGRQVHDFAMLRKDGSRLLVRAQAAAVRDGDGRPAGVCCTFHEVHVRLDLERRLALGASLLADSSWSLLIVDADLRTAAVNAPATRALAASPADMLGEPLAEFFGGGLEELESALEHTLAGNGPEGPVELWLTLHDDGSHEDEYGDTCGGLPGGRRRCWLSGFMRLESPLASEPSPLGVAWIFQDVTRSRGQAQESARQRFRDSQLSRAARAAADCAEPLDAAGLYLDFALAGFAEHALLDLTGVGGGGGRPGASGGGPRLVRVAETPGQVGGASATHGVPVCYRPGHPALEALERGVPVRATGGVAYPGGAAGRSPGEGPAWAVEHRWPREAAHALCVALRSRGRCLGVVTFLRGPGRRGFGRADAAFAEDVALRIGAAVDLAGRMPG